MALIFFTGPEGTRTSFVWSIYKGLSRLKPIQKLSATCWKVVCTGEELKIILQRSKNVSNLSDSSDSKMTFVGDWAKLITENILNISEPKIDTDKEDTPNFEKEHSIPLKAFVELDCDYDERHGCRGYVVDHQRDCDGTPLYGISFNPTLADYLLTLSNPQDTVDKLVLAKMRDKIDGGWDRDALIIIHQDKV